MPIPYCSVHKRLFHQQRNAWVNRSQVYIDMLKRVCDILDAAEIDCSDYKVIETTCDQCVEIARQILHEQLEKRDPLQEDAMASSSPPDFYTTVSKFSSSFGTCVALFDCS